MLWFKLLSKVKAVLEPIDVFGHNPRFGFMSEFIILADCCILFKYRKLNKRTLLINVEWFNVKGNLVIHITHIGRKNILF